MLFNSGTFLYFFVAVYAAYLVLPHRGQNRLLLVASYLFYGYWDYRFLALILISTLVDFNAGRRIERARREGRATAARRWLALSIAVNLGILGFFKYFNFFADSLSAALGTLGVELSPFTLSVVLPVGISFYTFQTMSYSIDVYRGEAAATDKLLDFCLFVAFFPQLMAGPIERFNRLFPQIREPRRVTRDRVTRGGWLIFWGLFKKVFIADGLAPYTALGAASGGIEGALDTWLLLFAFAIRFYCDFSGYSDMALGLAALLGFRLSRNFYMPYFSRNPREIWGRFHITLGAWVRDYIYAPLTARWTGRGGRAAAVVVAMVLMGLWHGANWTFVVFGLIWGLVIVAYRVWRRVLRRAVNAAPAVRPLIEPLGVAATFLVFVVLLGFYVSPSIARTADIWIQLGQGLSRSPLFSRDLLTVLYYCAPLILMEIAQRATGRLDVVMRLPWPARAAVYLVLACLLAGVGAERQREFIYFQF